MSLKKNWYMLVCALMDKDIHWLTRPQLQQVLTAASDIFTCYLKKMCIRLDKHY